MGRKSLIFLAVLAIPLALTCSAFAGSEEEATGKVYNVMPYGGGAGMICLQVGDSKYMYLAWSPETKCIKGGKEVYPVELEQGEQVKIHWVKKGINKGAAKEIESSGQVDRSKRVPGPEDLIRDNIGYK